MSTFLSALALHLLMECDQVHLVNLAVPESLNQRRQLIEHAYEGRVDAPWRCMVLILDSLARAKITEGNRKACEESAFYLRRDNYAPPAGVPDGKGWKDDTAAAAKSSCRRAVGSLSGPEIVGCHVSRGLGASCLCRNLECFGELGRPVKTAQGAQECSNA